MASFSNMGVVVMEGGNTVVTITVYGGAPPYPPVTLNFSVGGTATAGVDHSLTTNTVSTNGAPVATLSIQFPEDAVPEDAESLVITLQPGTGYALGARTSITLNIEDNDADTTYTPALEVTAPMENAPVGATATLTGWCESRGTVNLVYLPAAGFVTGGAPNPASVPCSACSMGGPADCGPGINQRGRFSVPLAFTGMTGARTVQVNAVDGAMNAAAMVERTLQYAPELSVKAYVKASNTDAQDRFGSAVALSGNTLVVGAPYEASTSTSINTGQALNSAFGAGAAYVFTWNGTAWTQQAYLKPTDTALGLLFGTAVAISGDTVVVGAPGREGTRAGNTGDPSVGGAYVFVRAGTNWTQQAILTAINGALGDEFGTAVAVDGDRALVGAPKETSNAAGMKNSAINSGAAYAFTRSGTTWTQAAFIKASNTGEDDEYGTSVALRGTWGAVGAPGEDGDGSNPANNTRTSSGAVYLVETAGWTESFYVKFPSPLANDRLGSSVALTPTLLVAGAPALPEGTAGAGRVLVHTLTASTSTFSRVMTPPGIFGMAGMEYGFRVAVANNLVFVGAPGSGVGTPGVTRPVPTQMMPAIIPADGTVFAHLLDGTGDAILKSGNSTTQDTAGDLFGAALAGDGEHVAVGAPQEDSAATGVGGDAANNGKNESGAAWMFGW